MKKLLPMALTLVACSFVFTGCVDDDADVVYTDRPAVYGRGTGVDFYYTGDAPYSRQYGMLYYRDNGYYYRRNNAYVLYNQPVWSRQDYYARFGNDNWRDRRHVRREVRRERWDDRRDHRAERRVEDRSDWQRVSTTRDNRVRTRAISDDDRDNRSTRRVSDRDEQLRVRSSTQDRDTKTRARGANPDRDNRASDADEEVDLTTRRKTAAN